MTKRPGDVRRFSSALIASNVSGTCWYSSMHTGAGPATNNPGSGRNASRTARSSRSITVTPYRSAVSRSNVDFPTERARAARGLAPPKGARTPPRRGDNAPVLATPPAGAPTNLGNWRAVTKETGGWLSRKLEPRSALDGRTPPLQAGDGAIVEARTPKLPITAAQRLANVRRPRKFRLPPHRIYSVGNQPLRCNSAVNHVRITLP